MGQDESESEGRWLWLLSSSCCHEVKVPRRGRLSKYSFCLRILLMTRPSIHPLCRVLVLLDYKKPICTIIYGSIIQLIRGAGFHISAGGMRSVSSRKSTITITFSWCRTIEHFVTVVSSVWLITTLTLDLQNAYPPF